MTHRRRIAPVVGLLIVVAVLLYAPVRHLRYLSAAIIFTVAASYIAGRVSSRAVSVVRTERVVRTMRRQDATVTLVIENRLRVPVHAVTVADHVGDLFSRSSCCLVSLGPRGRHVFTYELQGHVRGAYAIGPVTVSTADPLRLFPSRCTMDAPGLVIVYPSVQQLSLRYRHGVPSGPLAAPNSMYEDVTQFRSLREYVPGDDMKRMNWKSSARTGKLYLNEFESTLNFPVMVILNFRRDDYPQRRRDALIERAAELAASVPFYYAQRRLAMGFVTNGDCERTANDDGTRDSDVGGRPAARQARAGESLPLRAGIAHAQRILELISTLRATSDAGDFGDLVRSTASRLLRPTRVILIAPPYTRLQSREVIALSRAGMQVTTLQVYSPEQRSDTTGEVALPNVVRVRAGASGVVHD